MLSLNVLKLLHRVFTCGIAITVLLSANRCAEAIDPYYTLEGTRLTIANPNPEVNGNFGGRAIADLDNAVAVGSWLTNYGNLQDNGVAYLFSTSDGSLLQTFLHPNPDRFNNFGVDVANFKGNTLITTYPAEFPPRKIGELFLFDNDSGQIIQRFSRPSANAFDGFGFGIEVIGNTIAVSAARDDVGATNSGAVHLFNGETGEYFKSIKSPSARQGDLFGSVTASMGNTLFVGSIGGVQKSGDVFAFNAQTGNLLYQLINPFPASGNEFGSSIATFGNVVAVGARGSDISSIGGGAVYFFDATTGEYVSMLAPQFSENRAGFGSSMCVVGNRLVVGAYNVWSLGENHGGRGVLYVYDLQTQLLTRLVVPPPETGVLDIFGLDIQSVGRELAVGYTFSGIGADDAGAVFFLSIPEPSLLYSVACMVFTVPFYRWGYNRKL